MKSILGIMIFFLLSNYALGIDTKLIFTGDILLSREVTREIELKNGVSPWGNFDSLFKNTDWIMGNLEGSIGESKEKCLGDHLNMCFDVHPSKISLIKNAGFSSLSIENNHSMDLGDEGKINTRNILLQNSLWPNDFEHSPGFFKKNGNIISFIAVNNVKGKDGKKIEIPSNELYQKIRLAKSLSNWLIVNVHWGNELNDWPNENQKKIAKWMIKSGVDVIIGHHPHVIQGPECLMGHPVFYSLGNHVFDQKYPETKNGLIAKCEIKNNQLSCNGINTLTPANSSFPEISPKKFSLSNIKNCVVKKNNLLKIDDFIIGPRITDGQYIDGEIGLQGENNKNKKHWSSIAKKLLGIGSGFFKVKNQKKIKEYLFTLESHMSSIDKEVGPRPYVYEVGPHGLIAKWRGSALAWPIVDATLLNNLKKMSVLCVLHRRDSFIALAPETKETKTALYTWNGFGFSGIEGEKLKKLCSDYF
jgi:hypothetical protein